MRKSTAMPVGWTEKSRGVTGLFAQGTSQARDDQILSTRPAVLCPQTFDEKLHLWSTVRKRHVVKHEVPTTPQTDQVARIDKPLNLRARLQEGEVMVLRTHIGSVDGSLRAPKRLPLDLVYTGRQEHRKPNQQPHSSHNRYPLGVGSPVGSIAYL